jgi:hypothetical protein
MGVFAPLVGVMGSLQATEALKLSGRRGHLAGRAFADADGRSMEWSSLRTALQSGLPGVRYGPHPANPVGMRLRAALACAGSPLPPVTIEWARHIRRPL